MANMTCDLPGLITYLREKLVQLEAALAAGAVVAEADLEKVKAALETELEKLLAKLEGSERKPGH